MKHRISAGVLVDVADRILLVRCTKPGAYDFWVAPGGGVDGSEDLRTAIRREAREECGLEIEPLEIAYVEDLWTPETRICKLWFTGQVVGGELTTSDGCLESLLLELARSEHELLERRANCFSVAAKRISCCGLREVPRG